MTDIFVDTFTGPDAYDTKACNALNDLQAVVNDFLYRTGKSINDLTEEEQQRLVDSIDPQLAFELEVSTDIYVGLPLTFQGDGGFLVADADGSLIGAETTGEGDRITGLVSSVRAYPVPTLAMMLEAAGTGDDIGRWDQSLSAVVILGNAKIYSQPSADGTYQVVNEVGDLQIILPVIYGMKTRVSDIDS